MITINSCHTNACFDAWIKCESLYTEAHAIKRFLSKKVLNVINECALICMGTFHALKSGSANIPGMAILCVGICEECAEICEAQYGEAFQHCATLCRQCSTAMSNLHYTS